MKASLSFRVIMGIQVNRYYLNSIRFLSISIFGNCRSNFGSLKKQLFVTRNLGLSFLLSLSPLVNNQTWQTKQRCHTADCLQKSKQTTFKSSFRQIFFLFLFAKRFWLILPEKFYVYFHGYMQGETEIRTCCMFSIQYSILPINILEHKFKLT